MVWCVTTARQSNCNCTPQRREDAEVRSDNNCNAELMFPILFFAALCVSAPLR